MSYLRIKTHEEGFNGYFHYCFLLSLLLQRASLPVLTVFLVPATHGETEQWGLHKVSNDMSFHMYFLIKTHVVILFLLYLNNILFGASLLSGSFLLPG